MSLSISSTPQYAPLQTLSALPVTAPIAQALSAAEVTTPLQPDNATSKTPADSEALLSKSTFNQEVLNQKLNVHYGVQVLSPEESAAKSEKEAELHEWTTQIAKETFLRNLEESRKNLSPFYRMLGHKWP